MKAEKKSVHQIQAYLLLAEVLELKLVHHKRPSPFRLTTEWGFFFCPHLLISGIRHIVEFGEGHIPLSGFIGNAYAVFL